MRWRCGAADGTLEEPQFETHLLQKILRPVKVLLVWWQRAAGAAEGTSALEAEEDEVEEEEAAEVEAKGPSPPSCSEVSC